jgi:ABC-type nickel/cobalt efflux system permease component RcnA
MSVTSDFMSESTDYSTTASAIAGAITIARIMQRIVGVALIAAASGLWLAPGADFSSDVMLMKMGLSAFVLILGFWLVFSVGSKAQTEVELDVMRSELRIMRPGPMGAMLVVYSRALSDLGRVQKSKKGLKFWDEQGAVVADVHVSNQKTMDVLVSGLRDAGQAV